MAEDSKFDQQKGNIKETIGNATGDKDMESEGKKDKNAGKAKEFVDKAKNKTNETIDKFTKGDKK
ncbi:CsbD family protein [Salinicoccus halitifaciens]|uniref:Uncharacterized protein YjbJ (UPF0337 family) n=1 Tax=Salinicoccus halitifaciens TaxID=1073415 RepID=A0ABV2E7Z3_9STAP|nr:CsbD family protein [Salinicoccus halitifaciens]MCD2137076.1 CsbD family protein [Salinicoccus halitifaciens]